MIGLYPNRHGSPCNPSRLAVYMSMNSSAKLGFIIIVFFFFLRRKYVVCRNYQEIIIHEVIIVKYINTIV